MLSIGEFSRVTRLSVKALRLYHDLGLLEPDHVQQSSGYRYYGPEAVERAARIVRLKDMGFGLEEIRDILRECRDDAEMVGRVEGKLAEVERNLQRQRDMRKNLQSFLGSAAAQAARREPGITVEDVPDLLICGQRFQGRYEDIGPRFGALLRACGAKARGRPFSLYYDGEYREDDADIEVAVEVRSEVRAGGFVCRTLPGGKAVTLIHAGPYETLGRGYLKIFEHCRRTSWVPDPPVRELYLKGPGLIFRGHPRRYLTKLMIFGAA